MLVVSAQIWPRGDEGQAYLVGEIIAANESGLSRVSSYSVSISQGPAPKIGIGGWERKFTLEDHRRAEGVWTLVAAILSAVDCTGSGVKAPGVPDAKG